MAHMPSWPMLIRQGIKSPNNRTYLQDTTSSVWVQLRGRWHQHSANTQAAGSQHGPSPHDADLYGGQRLTFCSLLYTTLQ
jgi:hypothetical protein